MCDGTGLTPKLGARGGGSGGSFASAPFVTFRQLQRPEFQKDFVVIDIREEFQVIQENKKVLDEAKSDNKTALNVGETMKARFPDIGYAEIPMGKLLSGSFQSSDEFKTVMNSRIKVGILCPRGGRAQVTADSLVQKTNYDVYVIKGGISSLKAKFATDDDWVCILSHLNNDTEKVGIALNLCNAAAAKGKSVTLVLMHSAVYLGTQKYHDGAEKKNDNDKVVTNGKDKEKENAYPLQIDLPKPFKQWKVLFDSLISKKGQILCCTSCLKKRGISPQNDLIKQAIAIRGPDIIDITSDAGFVMQFT